MSHVVDLAPRTVDLGRLPLRRRIAPDRVAALVAGDPFLAPLRAPEVIVDVDVTTRRPDGEPGWALLRCHHGLAGDRVASTAWAGGLVEVTSLGVEHWQSELARAADVPTPSQAPPEPAARIDVPLEVLLGADDALRTGRGDLLDELVGRAATDDPAGLRDQLVRLHAGVVGRLTATVARRADGTTRLGWVSWLLFGDGWRSLTPVRRGGRPVVHLAAARPPDLGAQVASLVTLVRGRAR